jgi:hypothetical protein
LELLALCWVLSIPLHVVQQQLGELAEELVLVLGVFPQVAAGLLLDSLYVAYPEKKIKKMHA